MNSSWWAFSLLLVGCATATVHDDELGDGGRSDAPRADARGDDAFHTDATTDAADGTAVVLDQTSNDTTIVIDNSIACKGPEPNHATAENSYYRAFRLGEHGVSTGSFHATSMTFAVENAVAESGTTQPATVRLHRYSGTPGTAMALANFTTVAAIDITIPNGAQTIQTIPISATFPGNSVVVAELLIPDGDPDNDDAGNLFFIGSNAGGEVHPGYLRAPTPGCDVVDPTSIDQIAPAPMHILLSVAGNRIP